MQVSKSNGYSSESEFKQLYVEYYPFAVRTAMYILKSSSIAEDVAQNVFLKLWDKRDQLVQIENLKSYIARMSHNGALDVLKDSSMLVEEDFSLMFDETIPEGDNDEVTLKTSLEKALVELSPKCRLVFSLIRLEGLSNEEIADYLSISIRTVETQISAALKRFRSDLKHLFVDLICLALVLSRFLYI
jgi:RNA polymerase sigma-70 factor (ECF subfamily)